MATTVEHTIGTGGDYATIAAWLTATANPVGDDAVYVGKLKSEEFTSQDINLAASTSDSTRYRVLTYETAPYDPRTDTGPKVSRTWASDANSLVRTGAYNRVIGIGGEVVANGYNGTIFNANGTDGLIDGCTAILTGTAGSGTDDSRCGFHANSTGTIIRNCAYISKIDGGGHTAFAMLNGSVYNCTSYNAGRQGFNKRFTSGVLPTPAITNCVAIDSALNDYIFSGTDHDISYCVSSDTTATGTGSATSKTAAECFEDAASDDLRPKDGGPLDDLGTDLSSAFTTDLTGATRSLWSIGAYDAPPTPAGTPPDDPTGAAADDSVAEQITVTWTDNATDEDNYVVERSADGSTGWSVLTSSLPSDTETYTDSGLTPTDTWYYRVKATNAFGDSAYTSVVSGTVTGSSATAVINKNFATTEYIPAHFSFSGWGSTPGSGGLKDCKFKWTISGGSEHDGIYTGPNLGLVFETAGTFTVRLDFVDVAGNTDDASTTVTVATPTYANVIYVSADGSDSNDGLTDAAPKQTFDAAIVAIKAAHSAGDHSCVYLRKGDTFTCGTTLVGPASSNGTIYLRAYGSGDNPKVTAAGSVQLIEQANTSSSYYGWRVLDVDFEQTGNTNIVRLQCNDGQADRGYDFVAVRSAMTILGTGLGCVTFGAVYDSQSVTTYEGVWPGYARCGNVALMDCDLSTLERYGCYGEIQWFSVYRGSVRKPVGTQGEHCIRIQSGRNCSIRRVTFESTWDATTQLRFGANRYDWSATYRLSSHNNTIEGCEFITGNYLALQMCYEGPDEDNLLVTPGRQIAINNKFIPHPTEPYSSGTFTCIEAYGDNVALVGNACVGDCNPVSVRGSRGTSVVDSAFEMLVANNSFENESASSRYLITLSADYPVTLAIKNNALAGTVSAGFINGSSTSGELERITSDHNVADVTTWATNVGSAGTRTLAQWQTDSSQDANSTAADPAFADPANDDWSIGVDSPCYDAGENIGASWLTREGTERSGTWDIGAFEIPAASPTSENMSGYLNLANIRVRAGQTLAMAFTGTGNAKGRYILTVELE